MTTSKRIVVKIGEYTDRSGAQKARWKNVGEVITKDDGDQFVKIDATCLSMQLFALANRERSDYVLCGLFSNDDKATGPAPAGDADDAPF